LVFISEYQRPSAARINLQSRPLSITSMQSIMSTLSKTRCDSRLCVGGMALIDDRLESTKGMVTSTVVTSAKEKVPHRMRIAVKMNRCAFIV
jgi:hypothetical protein